MKKAQGAAFNWIFIVLAGAIILVFFITFALNYTDIQNKKTEFTIARNFDSTIEVLKTSTEEMYCDTEISENCFSLGFVTKVNLICENKNLRMILNDNIAHDLQGQSLFAPTNFQTRHLDFWIKKFNFPYYSSNLIYMQPPNKKIYVIGEDLDFPIIFDIETLSSLPEDIEPNSKVSFVNTDVNPRDLEILRNKNINYNMIDNNQVTFDDGEEFKIFTEEMKIAAVFTDDSNLFKCNHDILLKQHYRVTQTYFKKANELKAQENPSCSYNLIQQTLSQFAQEPTKELAEALTKQNQNLISNGCTELF